MAKVYAIAMQKGGVAKTTAVIHIAAAIARRGKRVLLIDMDPQASLSEYFFKILKKHLPVEQFQTILASTMYNLLVEGKIIEPVQLGAKTLLLPASIDLQAAELVFPVLPTTREKPNLVLAKYLSHYLRAFNVDVCLIDCGPSLGLLTKNALAVADGGVIIPVATEEMAVEGLPKILATVQDVRTDEQHGSYPGLQIFRIIPTLYDGRISEDVDFLKQIQAYPGYQHWVYPEPMHRRAKYKRAVRQGVDAGYLDKDVAAYWDRFVETTQLAA